MRIARVVAPPKIPGDGCSNHLIQLDTLGNLVSISSSNGVALTIGAF